MGTSYSCCGRHDEDDDDESVTVRGLEIGSPQFPQTTLNLDMHNLRPITRHDGRAVDIYPEIRSMPRTMNLADLGHLGETTASAVAVDEQAGRTTPEVAPVVETTKEEEAAVTMDTAIDTDTAVAEAEVAAATSVSSTTTDAEDVVVAETVAPGTAR
ncbi:hypothetical protein RJZ56_007652 [Blastomyces dermatitidis]|uniref:Uncharacterized protein n=2 Tax=Ajellomyces dermatitidis TaxID=5039 RepID=F2TE46_AJEDA|nr:uncharacterized protein BDCG_05694 [Blastomyces dermatitidis ER-3]EEQ90574.1 hypothetical protein BDCG_05694 [Blastomyces dermatitidis ER-3]EGE81509.1 hypothetical protein BDDG_04451 [Blastomyces dermatitidis ATCC 18188]EQL35526.1 hypothetical protein BDFG_02748 [Blastomyces dermatitidis ATCC 26199]